jgi:uncharacterized protein YndB with AHSA1/START domain
VSEAGRCEVRITRRVRAPREEVWAALTDPESTSRWLDPRCRTGLGGAAVELYGPDGEAVTARVRQLEPGRVLELDWERDGDVSVVRFELSGEGDETTLVLDHRRMDARIGMAYAAAWTRAVERLLARVAR